LRGRVGTGNEGPPFHAEASGHGGRFFSTPVGIGLQEFFFTSASASGCASVDPGVLRVYGSNLAVAQPAQNGPNLPVSPNGHTVYTHIEVGASFTDRSRIGVAGLPAGSAVRVPFNYLAEVV
jgi:hypothetical protein